MPAFTILIEVEIFAPLDQVVDLIVKVFVTHFLELHIVERIFVERLELLLEAMRLHSSLIHCISLFGNQLRILGVSIKFSQPTNFAVSSLLRSSFFA